MRQCEEYTELCEIPVSQSRAFTNIRIYRVRHKSCNMTVFHAIFHVQLLAEQNKKRARAAQNVLLYVEWPNFV